MIYLASPYTHENGSVRHQRYVAAHQHCVAEMSQGKIIFSPIVYGHEFARKDLNKVHHHYWLGFNEHMMNAANEIHVLMLEGWRASKGVQSERIYAELINKPVVYVSPRVPENG